MKVYDERSGLCLENSEGDIVMIQGAILTDIMAIGGETTGISIKTPNQGTYELILKTAEQEKLKKLNGIWFEVAGEFIIIESVEMKGRNLLQTIRIRKSREILPIPSPVSCRSAAARILSRGTIARLR